MQRLLKVRENTDAKITESEGEDSGGRNQECMPLESILQIYIIWLELEKKGLTIELLNQMIIIAIANG